MAGAGASGRGEPSTSPAGPRARLGPPAGQPRSPRAPSTSSSAPACLAHLQRASLHRRASPVRPPPQPVSAGRQRPRPLASPSSPRGGPNTLCSGRRPSARRGPRPPPHPPGPSAPVSSLPRPPSGSPYSSAADSQLPPEVGTTCLPAPGARTPLPQCPPAPLSSALT